MHLPKLAVSAALAGLLLAPAAQADSLLPNIRLTQLFNRPPPPPADVDDEPPARSGPSNSELVVRLDRLERLNRELTGQIEQLQFQVRRLEEQARGQPAPSGAAAPQALPQVQPLPQVSAVRPAAPGPSVLSPAATPPVATPPANGATTPIEPGRLRRGDAFDPQQNPTAPGAPRQLGTTQPSAPLQAGVNGPLTAGRDPGEAPNPMKPVDLGGPRPAAPPPQPGAPAAGETQIAATQPQGPKEEYDLASAFLKQGQYDSAQKGFEEFIAKHGKSRYMADAVFGLGETYFQRGRHREAAEQYLKISTSYANSARGPEAMLRLGQSLNALGAKEQACASFAEVGRKYPGASTTIRAADRESKKISC